MPGCGDDHGNGRGVRKALQFVEHFEAGHLRHGQIEEYQVRMDLTRPPYSVHAGRFFRDRYGKFAQVLAENVAIGFTVVDDQDLTGSLLTGDRA